MLHHALDGAALAGRIASLEQDHHALTGIPHPVLQLEQFDLQLVFLRLVFVARHLLVVRIDVALEQLLQRGGRQFLRDLHPVVPAGLALLDTFVFRLVLVRRHTAKLRHNAFL